MDKLICFPQFKINSGRFVFEGAGPPEAEAKSSSPRECFYSTKERKKLCEGVDVLKNQFYDLSKHDSSVEAPKGTLIIEGSVDATPFNKDPKKRDLEWCNKIQSAAKSLLVVENRNRFTVPTKAFLKPKLNLINALAETSFSTAQEFHDRFEKLHPADDILGRTGTYNIVLAFQRVLDMHKKGVHGLPLEADTEMYVALSIGSHLRLEQERYSKAYNENQNGKGNLLNTLGGEAEAAPEERTAPRALPRAPREIPPPAPLPPPAAPIAPQAAQPPPPPSPPAAPPMAPPSASKPSEKAEIFSNSIYQTGNFGELLERDGIPSEAIDELYGKDRPNISYLELEEVGLKALDDDRAVKILSLNNIVAYLGMVAFTMKADHKALLTAMKTALNIREDIQFPLVVLKKDASVVPKAHELTHAIKAEIYSDVKSLHDYINNPGEREAFLNSILVYRLKNPAGSFFDFAREQESVTKEEFPDEKIQDRIEGGRGKHWSLQQQMWHSIDKQIKQGTQLKVDNLSTMKRSTKEEIEKSMPSVKDMQTFSPAEIQRLKRYSGKYSVERHTTTQLNRTYPGRLNDHIALLKDVAAAHPNTTAILNAFRGKPPALFIDIGPGIANADSPAITSREMAEQFSNMKTIVLDLPTEVDRFKRLPPEKQQELTGVNNLSIVAGDGLKPLRQQISTLPPPGSPIVIRAANSIDIYCEWKDIEPALIQMAKDFVNYPVLLLFNREIILKEENSATWKIVGQVSKKGFQHNTRIFKQKTAAYQLAA